jgi:hypothetical protein
MTQSLELQNSNPAPAPAYARLIASVWALTGALVLIALMFFISSISSATPLNQTQTLTGQLINKGDDSPLQMQLKSHGNLVNIDASPRIISVLRRLRPNDLMTVQGTVSADNSTVTIESIDRLGLQELLGAWRTRKWEVFEFKTYSQLELFLPSGLGDDDDQAGTPRVKTVNYAVTPDNDDGFSIFMSDENGVKMGFLKVAPDSLSIAIPDPQTGEISETISLVPVRFK